MKKTQRKHLFRTIRKNLASFLAVAAIAATGVSIYLGNQSAAMAILEHANNYFVENELQSLEVTCANGITKEDIETIASWEGVDAVEGGYTSMVLLETETGKTLIQAYTLLEKMNKPVIVEGTLPTAENEAAIEQMMAEKEGIQVGDTITVDHEGELKSDTFVVTAVINEPSFSCAKDSRGKSDKGIGSAYYYISLPKESFDESHFDDCYTTAYIKNDTLDDYYYFSDEYKKQEAIFKEKIETLGEERATLRYESMNEEVQEANDIQFKNWIVSVRNDIGDVRSIETIVEGLYKLSYSMAIIFLIVSIMVCHGAISCMIREQREQIGVQKALGFSSKEIMGHYMTYSIICGIWGILQGWCFSFFLVQGLNLNIYESIFLLGTIPKAFSWSHAIIVSVICMTIFVISAYVACGKEIALPTTELLHGEVPEREKPFFFENWKGYQKLSLYSRTMIKNVLGDKSRMVTTIMGVVAYSSLFVICFMLQFAMNESSVIQFDKYFLYENRLVIDSSQGNIEDFEAVLDAGNIPYTRIQDKLKYYREKEGSWLSGHVVAVSDAQKLKDFMVLEDVNTREILEIPEEGLLVSVKCAENLGLKKGSVIELMDADGNPREVVIAGVIEHYLNYHMFVTSDSYYEEIMGEETDESVFLLKGNIDGLYDKVKNIDGFISLRDNSEYNGNGNSMNIGIVICFVFAAIMAVLVLFNQIVIYINQKEKELAVMRINGFTLKETKAFVSRDNTVLTIIGFILGNGLGMALGYLVIRVMEIGAVHYVRTPSIKACILATIVGGVLAFIVNKIALRKISHLNLTDINET